MKILLTVHQFLPEFSTGTEILTFETAKELQKIGHDVSVFTGFPAANGINDCERFDSYFYDGLHVNRFAHGTVPMGEQFNIVELEYNNLFFASYFRKYLKELQPDLVHFFHLQRLSASAIDVCYELNISMVMTPTDFWLVCPMNQLRLPDNSLCKGPDKGRINCLRHFVALTQSSAIVQKLDRLPDWVVGKMIWGLNKGLFSGRWFAPLVRALYDRPAFIEEQMNRLDRMIVPTRLLEKILIKQGLKEEKIVFCPFGINFHNIEQKIIPEETMLLRIGFIGTLAEHKGPHVLIDAIGLLPQDLSLEVKLYGKLDDYPEYVERLKASAGKDPRIRFYGTFPNSEIGEIFTHIDVLVVPSIWYENSPLVIYSAQAAGCPVIASDLEGMAEVVRHGDNGLLFQAGRASTLARLLESFIQDPAMLQNLSKNAAMPKSIVEYVSELVGIYNEVLNVR